VRRLELLAIGDALFSAPFTLVLDRMTSVGDAVILTPSLVPGVLKELQGNLFEMLINKHLLRGYHFDPHVTLRYGRGGDRYPGYSTIKVAPVRCRVEEVMLIHSIYGNSRHEVLGRWPLEGGQAEFGYADDIDSAFLTTI
jgi:2'-5' RNA ligase